VEIPAAAVSFYAVATKYFPTLDKLEGEAEGGPISVMVNGEAVESGAQEALTLALLGVTANPYQRPPEAPEFDKSFWRWMRWFWLDIGEMDEWARTHQDGTGWKLEAWVEPSAAAGEQFTIKDLAYCDPRQVRRRLTFTFREWNDVRHRQYAEPGFDASLNRTSTVHTHVEPLEFGGAVGSWYSGIDLSEIEATRRAAHALESARRNLERAFDEIAISMEVIKASWSGDRAEASLEKLRVESDIVGAIRDVAHCWEDFTQDVVRQQGLAKQHDDELKAEVKREVAIMVVAGSISFGVGAVARAAWFTTRLAKWAHDVDVLRRAIQSSRMATVNRVRNTALGIRAARASRLGIIEVTATVAVDGATGRPITADDLLTEFLLAAGLQVLPNGQPFRKTKFQRTWESSEERRSTLRESRARLAALRFQQRPGLKLDPGTETTKALIEMFRRTGAGVLEIARKQGLHLPQHSRGAAAEIRTIIAWARRADVVRIRAVPSASGGRTPDLVVDIRRPDGRVVPTRVEITTVTGAPNGYVKRGLRFTGATTVGRVKRAVRRKALGEPSQLEAPLTGVPKGGTIAVHLPRLNAGGPKIVDTAMQRLRSELPGWASVERIEFYLPKGAPIVYVRRSRGTYVLRRNLGTAPVVVPVRGGS
jgi:hypothetical protein